MSISPLAAVSPSVVRLQGCVKALLKGVEGVEFTPRRYKGVAAFFVSVPFITLDWDLDENQHIADCIVEGIDSLQDILHLLQQDVDMHPQHVWEMQQTRSGFHAVLLTECCIPAGIRDEWMLSLGCDPLYVSGRKNGMYDWRLTPKYMGDIICKPYMRVGNARTNHKVEVILRLYYTAIEALKRVLQEDPDFLYVDSWEPEHEVPQSVFDKLDEMGYVDWYSPEYTTNPLTGEGVYVFRAYHRDDPDWWKRVTIKA